MKNKKILLVVMAFLALASCENKENIFPDFDTKAVYFPLQYPLRTLILGEDRIDNTLDKELKFNVGVSIGGMYNNTKAWDVEVVWDESLAAGLTNGAGEDLLPLPQKYIKNILPSLPGQVQILPGSFNGTALVELNPEFLDDPLAISNRYVLPLRIASTNADAVLTGVASENNPNRNRSTDWSVAPKDFTLFGIRFINPYHGKYLHKGVEKTVNASGEIVKEEKFSNQYLERNDVWTLTTISKNACNTNGNGKLFSDTGDLGFTFTVDASNNVVISPKEGGKHSISGSGKFVPSSASNQVWGGSAKEFLALSYSWTEAGLKHEVTDTLVFRDRDIRFEEFKVSIK